MSNFSFNFSFQEWARKIGLRLPDHCTCRKIPSSAAPDQHAPECPWNAAWEEWRQKNRKKWEEIRASEAQFLKARGWQPVPGSMPLLWKGPTDARFSGEKTYLQDDAVNVARGRRAMRIPDHPQSSDM